MKKVLCILGSVLLSLVFAVQMVPWTSFAAEGDVYDDPDASTVYVNGSSNELDENMTEDPDTGTPGYYDNGTYTNRDLLEAGDYYVKKQFDWTDKENGKGKITFRTKLNVSKEPTIAVYAFTPCEAHGFRRATALKNIQYLVKNYDRVDLIWITGDYKSVQFINDGTGATSNGNIWLHNYDDIHITKNVAGDSDGNGRADYLDILMVTASGAYSTKASAWYPDKGLGPKYWSKTHTSAGHAGVHFGISLYTGLYAYLAGCDPTDLSSNPSQTLNSSENEPTAIYISFDGLLDTRTAASGVPYTQANNPLIVSSRYGYNNNFTYPLINYNCWPILYKMDAQERYFSLGMNGSGDKNEFVFAVGSNTGSYATTDDLVNMFHTEAYANSIHYQLWNELLALSNPSVLADKISADGSFNVADIPDDQLWNGVKRTTTYVKPGSTYLVFKNEDQKYHFDYNYQKTFEDLDVPIIGISLDDALSDSFTVDGDVSDVQVRINYPAGTPDEDKKTTVNTTIENDTISFSVNSYIKGTELVFIIPVKVDDENATTVNEWLDTNGDTSLTINIPNPDDPTHPIDVSYDVSTPKAHIEGYHIFTEVENGNIDQGRDIREGAQCTINYSPADSDHVLDSITISKTDKDGNVTEEVHKFTSEEELQQYLNSYTFDPVYSDMKITVVYVAIQDITVTKVWDDQSDLFNYRPTDTADLPITLTADPSTFTPGDPTVTKNNDNTWTYKWTGVRKYKSSEETDENLITYTFAEDTANVKAYETPVYNPTSQTITNNVGTVTNSIATVDVEGTKTWVDLTQKDHNNAKEIELKLTRKTANSEEETVTATPVWNGDNYKYSNLPKKDNNGDAYTYTVTETKIKDLQGNDITGYYNITQSGNNITNTIDPAFVQFEGTKTLNGRTLGANEFTFELYKSGETDPIESVNNDANGKFSFSQLKYDVTGTYNYTIKEKNNGLGGVTYDTKEYSVTVTVAVKNGKLTATVSGLNETETAGVYGPAAFTNKYEADPCTIQFKGVKTLTGRKTPLQKDEFSFNLKKGSDTLPTKKNGADGSFAFDAITYTAKGEYTYTISEKIPDDAVNNVKNGISYDPTEYTVKVTVDDDGQGHLYIKSVTGLNEDTGSTIYAGVYKGADFLNTYSASAAEVPIAGKKVLENYKPGLQGDDYEFTITGEWAPLPGSTGGSGKSEADKKTDAEKPAAEQQPAEEPAVDQQPAQEAPAADEAAEPEAKAVEAEEAAEEPEVKAEEPEKAEKKAEAAKPEAKKSDSDSEATRADDPTAPDPSNGKSVKNDANGVVDFGKIKFEAEGVYTYYVTEDGSIPGVENDPDSPKKITITVEDNGQGQLVATADPSDTVKFTFTNKYVSKPNSSSVTDSIKIKKELNGHELKADMFTFKMTTDDGKEIATVSNKADGVIEFPPIKFTEEGVYKYWIYEVDEGNKTITYDGTQYQVIATVTEEYTGDPLKVEWIFNGGDSITFKNTYYDQVVIDPPVKKVIKGKAPKKAETYTFKMQADDPSNPMPKAAGGNSSMTVNIKGAGAKEFGEIVFTKPGTYSYTITEVPGKSSNCKYDNSVYKVVAIVTENPDYSLSVERKYYKNGKPVDVAIFEFTNTYSSDNSAGTGDSFKAGILILLMMGSAAAAAVVLRRRKSA